MKKHQFELPACGLGGVFNLSGETGPDPLRLERERWQRETREREAREYQERMQRTLAECPGFVGADPPASDAATGRVIIEPGMVFQAVAWLKRRFHVSENLDLSTDTGLCVEVAPIVRKKGVRKVKVTFGKPEQFTLEL